MNPNNSKKMINDFIGYLKKQQYAKQTINSYSITTGRFFVWLEQENIDPEQVSYNDLLQYMKYCSSKGMTQKGIALYMLVIKHFYNHLVKEEKIAINPVLDINVQGIKRKILYHILSPHELNKLYNNYDDKSPKEKRNKIMLGLLVYQGLKTEELSRLTVNHIKLKEGKIDVPGGKRSNERTMQLEPCQVMDMYEYMLQARQEIIRTKPSRNPGAKVDTERLFIGEGGRCYSVPGFIYQMMEQIKKNNPSVLNTKQIRASVITKWLKIYNLREVQYLSGHRYISSTEWYLENDLEGLQEEIQQYHPLG